MSDPDSPPRPAFGRWAAWLAALAAVTLVLLAGRAWLDEAHVALAYLLLVLGASARSGRAPGLIVAVASFFCFNFFFLPPYHTLVVAEPLDWLVLVAFLVTSAVAAQLLSRAQGEADEARARAAEVESLSAVGAEALNAGRAEEALAAIAEVIRATLGADRCEVYLAGQPGDAVRLVAERGAAGDDATARDARVEREDATADGHVRLPAGLALVRWVAASGRAVVERVDGTPRAHAAGADIASIDVAGARVLLLPLRVGERQAGVLRLAAREALRLDAPRRRFLAALSYYAALGVDRVRLVSEAEHADALRQADVLKDALLASVSHDLRTPLTTIKALAHDIRIEGDERAATIEEESDRLNRFVADLLDLSRLAGGAMHVAPEVNAVEDLVGAALQRVSGAIDGREVRVRLDAGEPLLLGRFDFVHALRIVVNLIENAHKYSAPDAPIEVEAHLEGEAVEIVVSDRGPGVAESERERIFEAFHRPPKAAPDAGGAGLGLSIARGLAEAQGGTLRHEPREGGGSRFVLRLPAASLAG